MPILHGGLALGSAGWGELANRTSPRLALLISAAGLALGIVGTGRYSLNHFEKANLDPSMHWPDPTVVYEIDREHGHAGPEPPRVSHFLFRDSPETKSIIP